MSEMEQGIAPNVIVDFEPVGKRFYAAAGKTVLQVAQGLELFEHGISAPCGGKGLCAQCLVRLITGELSPLSLAEAGLLSQEHIAEGYRLACQAKVAGPCKLEIPVTSFIGRQQLQIKGYKIVVEPDFCLDKHQITGLQKASIGYPYSLWQQVEQYLKEKCNLPEPRVAMNLLRSMDPLADGSDVMAYIAGNEVVAVTNSGVAYEPLGLAVDLGTTKIAAFLTKLETGEVVASEGILNPQIAYGEDLLSRLAYAMESEENAARMARIAAGGINQLVKLLTIQGNVESGQIIQTVIAANTAMHHLLLRLPVRQLALSPYLPATTKPLEVTAEEIGLELGYRAAVYMLPPVGGFVGGDHVAMILGSRIDQSDSVVLGIDIGTNTEIVLAAHGRLMACSCASGPAFEGAHVTHGMRAVNGAISEIKLVNNGLDVRWKTVGGQKPVGLCGSGIIDLVAELNRQGIIAANGRLLPGHPKVRSSAAGNFSEFLIVSRQDSSLENDIAMTQKDLGEIQLAKAAIASGIELLLESQGIQAENIDKVIIAGAFGSFLQVENAIAIGLLPDLPLGRFEQVGNAAGTGALMALLSKRERCRAEKLASKIEHVELAALPQFKRAFAQALKFPKRI